MKKIINFFDKPIFWFIFIVVVGSSIVSESYEPLYATIVFIFSIIVWEYERKKKGK